MQEESQLDRLDILDDLHRKDFLLCSIMILIFAIIGIWNIGTLNIPTTGWISSHANESFYIDLKNQYYIDRMDMMEGVHPHFNFRIYSGSPNNWNMVYNGSRENFFKSWIDIPINSTSRYIKFVAGSPKVDINEIVIYTRNYKKIPLSTENILCEYDNTNESNNYCEQLYNLVDEQYKVEDPPSYISESIFDEIYFARTAYQHIIREAPFENTHPPLGKLLIAIGISTFGLNTIGWRIVPYIFGIVLIPIMYIFGKRLFKTRFGAFTSAFLMGFDNMHLVLSRIALTETILSTFVVLMFYFFFIYYDGDLFKTSWKGAYLPLFISGIFFGMAVSVKWTAIFGAFAVTVLLLTIKNDELNKAISIIWSKHCTIPGLLLVIKNDVLKKEQMHNQEINEKQKNKIFKPNISTPIIIMLISYVIISLIIYYLSYTPIMGIPGEGSGLDMVLRYQHNMFLYHTTLTATHPFSSLWWTWPFMIRPVWVWGLNNTFDNTVSDIVIIGNPAIWWATIPSIFFVILGWIWQKDRIARFIAIAFLLQWVPYILIGRVTFIYHMFPNLPFMIFAIVYCLNKMWNKDIMLWGKNQITNKMGKNIAILYLTIVLLTFIFFYPIVSGYTISYQFNDLHKWLSSWGWY